MPDLPDASVKAAAEVLFRQYESEYAAGHLTWRDFEADAREILEAAAPAFAEEAAAAILRHMERSCDRRGRWRGLRAYRRHFATAARIAATAFTTDEDLKREAAKALVRIYRRHMADAEVATDA